MTRQLRTIIVTLSIWAALLLAAPLAQADSVSIFDEPAGIDRPHRGITMAEVEQQFGKPASTMAPVGEPPITRWVYDGFTVYFEHDRVIHSVAHRK